MGQYLVGFTAVLYLYLLLIFLTLYYRSLDPFQLIPCRSFGEDVQVSCHSSDNLIHRQVICILTCKSPHVLIQVYLFTSSILRYNEGKQPDVPKLLDQHTLHCVNQCAFSFFRISVIRSHQFLNSLLSVYGFFAAFPRNHSRSLSVLRHLS